MGDLRLYNVQSEISNLLNTFAFWNRCFTVREVAEWSDEAVDLRQLRQAFSDDDRFVLLSQPGWGLECFLPERTLFRWWAGLNLRLADIRQARLTERQLTTAMNSLRPEGIWFTPPADLLNYGQRFGFVALPWASGSYAFPLAHILGQMPPMVRRASRMILDALASQGIRNEALKLSPTEVVDSVLAQFGERASHIVRAREGIPPYEKATLEELGKIYGCTRERVRQIDKKFWTRIKRHQAKYLSSFIAGFLAGLMRRQGSLVLDLDQEETPVVCFLAKCLDVPYFRLSAGNFVVLSICNFDSPAPEQFASFAEWVDTDKVAEHLDAGTLSFLKRDDISQVAKVIAGGRFSRLSKQEKVYLALKYIGKPAHFSEVTKNYNSLFSDDLMPERNLHSILSRCAAPGFEQYGIVWTGAKGTYALKECGYARPDMGIFEAVAKVVEERYAITRNPVHTTVIATELGKYRQLINPNSLVLATGANPRLEQVSKDFFVPKNPQRETWSDERSRSLDAILREFQADHTDDS